MGEPKFKLNERVAFTARTPVPGKIISEPIQHTEELKHALYLVMFDDGYKVEVTDQILTLPFMALPESQLISLDKKNS